MVYLDEIKNHRNVMECMVVENNNLCAHFLDVKNSYHNIGLNEKKGEWLIMLPPGFVFDCVCLYIVFQ